MKRIFQDSIQTRLVILLGLLTLTATTSAIFGIVSAAIVLQKLARIEQYVASLGEHAKARGDLLQAQVASKNMLIADEYRPQDYGDYSLHSGELATYLYQQELRNTSGRVQALSKQYSTFDQEMTGFVEAFEDENADFTRVSAQSLDQLDPLVDNLNSQIMALDAEDTLSLRAQVASAQENAQNTMLIGQIALVALSALVIVGAYQLKHLANPIENLTCAVVAFENNTYSSDLLAADMRRADELGKLSSAIDGMARSISDANQLKEEFLQAAKRFVPSQYLEFLGKPDITQVQLGDHVRAEMAVMFSDIRGFTSMSENMTAKENFDFVNEYLKLVSPIIQKHDGFIVKFLGDGMMAIFPYGVDDAVQAGIEKANMVQTFNQSLEERGYPPISVGIGVHTGPMMVGMIGEEFRMQGDAFSDNVNLTSRIEGLNKFYGTSMIISEDVIAQLPNKETLKIRPLGKAVVKGRATPLSLYEIYDGLPEATVTRKEATRANFEQGVALYAQGKFSEAGKYFNQVLEEDPEDKTARIYLELSAEWLDRPLPAQWDGAIVMESK